MNKLCPCGSGKSYEKCCEMCHKDYDVPNAETLMRSRYSAFVLNLIDYLYQTTYPSHRSTNLKEEISYTCKALRWTELKVLSTWQGKEKDKVGKVEFKAHYIEKNILKIHHEISRFKRYKGNWMYLDGKIL